MDIRARRAFLPAVLAIAFLLTAGWHAAPARATSVDPELVAESVTEDGYYVDSDASYLTSDADLDKLRAALQRAGRAGVVVLPSGAQAGPVLTRLMQTPNRKATYLVLSGTRLRAASNDLPKATVDRYLATSAKAGGPKAKVLTFLGLLGGQAHPAGKKGKSAQKSGKSAKSGNLPLAGGIAAKSGAPAPATPVAAAGHDSGGGDGLLYGVGGAAVVAAALGGLLVWRRKKGRADGTPGTAGPSANA